MPAGAVSPVRRLSWGQEATRIFDHPFDRMQSSNDATCCFMASRHAVDPGSTFAVAVAVAWESHEATSALNSVGAEPFRLQFQDQSASFVVAQAARATERESAKCRIASPPCKWM